ncbi:hypothetical protein [Haladaptatus sp. R4]|uniref:hypothetical protein n=1 Tax=Haladaptatus sp. R4 TaxID=1679489 RepID=UPI0012375A1D|nr:hypothetical protein [Haladaptatus sp. R4]
MKNRINDGLIMTGVGAVMLIGLYLTIPLPLQGKTAEYSGGMRTIPPIFPFAFAAIFFLIGVTALLGIYPGWGLAWDNQS